MIPTIIDTKELHYHSYCKDLQRFRGQQHSRHYIDHNITMSPTLLKTKSYFRHHLLFAFHPAQNKDLEVTSI